MATVSIEISDDAYKQLSDLAKSEGVSVAELIRRGVNLETFLRKNDAKVYVGDPDSGELRELQVA